MVTDEELLDLLEAHIAGDASAFDLLEKSPELTQDDAYRLQIGLMRRKVAKGDRHVGYKAAYTSLAMQRDRGVDGPIIGCLMQSVCSGEGQPVALRADAITQVEPEVAVLLKRDLVGPGLTIADVYAAIEGYFPAIEIAEQSIGATRRSRQTVIAMHKSNGGIVIGGPLHAPYGLDLRLEGMVLSVNGEVRASATAVEVLGNPLNAILAMADRLSQHGEALKAGMILMTGSIVSAIQVRPNDEVRVEFTRLGRLTVRFDAD